MVGSLVLDGIFHGKQLWMWAKYIWQQFAGTRQQAKQGYDLWQMEGTQGEPHIYPLFFLRPFSKLRCRELDQAGGDISNKCFKISKNNMLKRIEQKMDKMGEKLEYLNRKLESIRMKKIGILDCKIQYLKLRTHWMGLTGDCIQQKTRLVTNQ